MRTGQKFAHLAIAKIGVDSSIVVPLGGLRSVSVSLDFSVRIAASSALFDEPKIDSRMDAKYE